MAAGVRLPPLVGEKSGPFRVPPWQRGRIEGFVSRHAMIWELVTAGLTTAYVALSFLEDSVALALNPASVAIGGLATLFVLEFAVRFLDSVDRVDYLRNHWLDLVTAVPLIGPLRAVRLLRLVRVFRVGRSMRAAVRHHNGHRRNADDVSWLIWPFLLLFWFASSYAVWLFEGGHNPAVTSFGTAMFLTFLTASTVGYGSFVPVTVGGKVVCGLVVFVAIGLVGYSSSRLTARWLGDREQQIPVDIVAEAAAASAS